MPDNTPKSFVPDAQTAVPKSFVADVQPGVSSEGKPAFSAGSYQLRPGGPVLDPSKSPLRTGIESLEGTMGIHNPTSAMDALKQAGTSFAGFAGNALKEPFQDMTPGEEFTPMLGVRAGLAVPNLIARGVEGMAGGLESSIKDIAAGWRGGGQPNDWRSIAAGAGEFLGTKLQADAPESAPVSALGG